MKIDFFLIPLTWDSDCFNETYIKGTPIVDRGHVSDLLHNNNNL